MTSTLRAAALATGAIVLLLGPASASGLAHPDDGWRDPPRTLDLTTSAHPTEADPNAVDQAIDVSSTWRSTVRAHTTALSSVTCDGCRGDAATLQVLYLHHARSVAVDNAALAWGQCAGCGGTAVSVQIVVVSGGRQVSADNRALAANAACAECRTAAMVYQLVVVSPDHARLSKGAVRDLRRWAAKQSAALRSTPVALSRRPMTPQAQRRAAVPLEQLVNGDLDSRTRAVHVARQ